MDDVNLKGVNITDFMFTMQRLSIEVAAPTLPFWHWKVMMRDQKRQCAARYTKYMDMLFTVFTLRAWTCWQQQIDTTNNPLGWGMDATFHFTCGMRMAILDGHMARHVDLTQKREEAESVENDVTRSYNETQAHAQLAHWLASKAAQYNVTFGMTDIAQQYMQYLMRITEAPTECVT
eukprot:TRINITY_DN115677_c0_g1_i1.p1 TRINITY_DN115677_c0_g1~~TRINITY_DN115677_c0_g1_i1.p1  ORF type:complete len:177 (+),score=21.51 TRINITY_DN115677_c0_g1_i1:26-556(+)